MRLTIISLIALVLFTGCDDKESDGSEMYLGSYRIMDQLIPYPYIFQQKKDSIFLFDNTGFLIDKIESRKIKDEDELKFIQKHFKIWKKKDGSLLAYDLLDTVNFRQFENGGINHKDVAKFEKISAVKKLDIQQIKNEIENSIWNYDVEEDENTNPNQDLDIKQLLHFKNDSLNIITSYYYQGLKTVSEQETKAYFIFEIDENYFLSFQKENDNPQPIYQITGYDAETIELKDFSSKTIKDISFYRDSMSTENYSDLIANTSQYSNCFDGFQGEYYHNDITFNQGNNYILDYANVDAPTNDTESGYIIIHFNINCNGDVGKFGLLQMNREFKQTAFTQEMVSHLLNKVSLLKDFPFSNSKSDWVSYKDVHGFLMFKLEKGKITDLCP